jgi:hypothetical protein
VGKIVVYNAKSIPCCPFESPRIDVRGDINLETVERPMLVDARLDQRFPPAQGG